MHKMILVKCGEKKIILESIMTRCASHLFLRFDYVRLAESTYCFVENIPYEVDHNKIKEKLEAKGISTIIITEPHNKGYDEVVFPPYHDEDAANSAVDLMSRLVETKQAQ